MLLPQAPAHDGASRSLEGFMDRQNNSDPLILHATQKISRWIVLLPENAPASYLSKAVGRPRITINSIRDHGEILQSQSSVQHIPY